MERGIGAFPGGHRGGEAAAATDGARFANGASVGRCCRAVLFAPTVSRCRVPDAHAPTYLSGSLPHSADRERLSPRPRPPRCGRRPHTTRVAPANGISSIGASRTGAVGFGAWIICPCPT
ncbi:hypothetical protein SAVCW2_46020 [Streptomyces avermitilis]|uniref:Uncharacterized protein n=1 Tax=Streptomyces avermitilis TaxID=33903 RepID=A0A4D4MW86_STRAX|nr:hypothetical protein SAV31267_059470 [Streptomyces avermitilis]GDY85403.1 hypothetical protein SAVCW2_46020 [Streptomyces avermitilis]